MPPKPELNIQEVLRHASNLIPFGEQQFIDKATELLNSLDNKEGSS